MTLRIHRFAKAKQGRVADNVFFFESIVSKAVVVSCTTKVSFSEINIATNLASSCTTWLTGEAQHDLNFIEVSTKHVIGCRFGRARFVIVCTVYVQINFKEPKMQYMLLIYGNEKQERDLSP